MTGPAEEDLPAARAGGRWRRLVYVVAALAVAALVGLRLAGGSSPRHAPAAPVPQAVVESLVPSATADPFCSTVSPCTLEHTVSGVVATALLDDVHATLVTTETYLSAGIELTTDSLQSRRIEARAGAVSIVVIITVEVPAPPAPPVIGHHAASLQVSTVRAHVGHFVVDVVALGARLPARQDLVRLAGDQRLLAVG